MLGQTDRQVAAEFKRRLSRVTPILEMRVFGSRARGDAEPDSDLDIFIRVETCPPQLRRQIREIAWEVGFEMDRIITTIVATSAQLEHGPMGVSPLMVNIEREGIPV